MASSVNRARPQKSAPKRIAEPKKTQKAEEAIAGFIRTLERLDSVSTTAASATTQNKA